MNNELFHYGTPHVGNIPHSGRYEYGSGDKYEVKNYIQKLDFLSQIENFRKEGKSDSEIAKAMDLTVNEFRKRRAIANAEIDAARKTRARRLRDHGYKLTEIGEMMGGYNESTVRGWLKASEETRKNKIDNVADIIENHLKKGEIIDVGPGSEISLGCTASTLKVALKQLEDKGYKLNTIDVKQPLDSSKNTTVSYISQDGVTRKQIFDGEKEIITLTEHSEDKGLSFNTYQQPTSIDDSRIAIVYKEEGGIARDGLIGLRKGVADVTLGDASYAQVRIAVNKDGKDAYYIKGMAIYDDNVPDGADIVVYSNKSTRYSDKANLIEGALKETKSDPMNPFGAVITAAGQTYYTDKKGKYVKVGDVYKFDPDGKIQGERYNLSPINKLKEEGEWDKSKKSLSAQVLSKQSLELINTQLDITYKSKFDEYSDISSLTNETVKKKLLNDFAESCDKDAKDLKAAALPRQNTRVLIPVPELKDTEVYAPTYKNGERLVLIRFPHAGTFEIPTLVVNNKNEAAKNLLGNAADAIGINKKVADRLSGADFDGDFVLTIPVNDKVKITTRNPLKGLENFDTQEAYPGYPGMKVLSSRQKQIEMGKITNLITDMTLQKPTEDELARAVKHSMVIIDAEKHALDYKRSEQDNGIEALKQRYQRNPDKKKGYGGASSLLTKAGSVVRLPELQMVNEEGKKTYTADPKTGKKLMAETGATYVKPIKDKDGNLLGFTEPKVRTKEYSPMDLVDDARKLSNGSPPEEAYASYANKMKALANKSRKEALSIKEPAKDPIAAKNYKKEVDSLDAKLQVALKNKPLERQALLRANRAIVELKQKNPTITDKDNKDKLKKEKAKILAESRLAVGAKKESIKITDKEWEAIQARAISPTKLSQILNNCDMDAVRKLSNPKATSTISQAKQARIEALSARGFTIEEISNIVGVSSSTVSKYK